MLNPAKQKLKKLNSFFKNILKNTAQINVVCSVIYTKKHKKVDYCE